MHAVCMGWVNAALCAYPVRPPRAAPPPILYGVQNPDFRQKKHVLTYPKIQIFIKKTRFDIPQNPDFRQKTHVLTYPKIRIVGTNKYVETLGNSIEIGKQIPRNSKKYPVHCESLRTQANHQALDVPLVKPCLPYPYPYASFALRRDCRSVNHGSKIPRPQH